MLWTRGMVLWLLAATPAPDVAHPDPAAAASLSSADLQAALRSASPAEKAEVMRQLPPDALLTLGRLALENLGNTYKMRLTKQERVKGDLLEPQQVLCEIREHPFAVRLRYVAGPATGRRVFYGEPSKSMRDHEAGVLGVLGAISVDTESSLTRRDTNHSITEMGFRRLLAAFEVELAHAKAAGGATQAADGFDPDGSYCLKFTNGPKATGRYANFHHVRICTDLGLGLPAKVEGFDEKGNLLERFQFTEVAPMIGLADDYFTAKAAGL